MNTPRHRNPSTTRAVRAVIATVLGLGLAAAGAWAAATGDDRDAAVGLFLVAAGPFVAVAVIARAVFHDATAPTPRHHHRDDMPADWWTEWTHR